MLEKPVIVEGFAVTRNGKVEKLSVQAGLIVGWKPGTHVHWERSEDEAKAYAAKLTGGEA